MCRISIVLASMKICFRTDVSVKILVTKFDPSCAVMFASTCLWRCTETFLHSNCFSGVHGLQLFVLLILAEHLGKFVSTPLHTCRTHSTVFPLLRSPQFAPVESDLIRLYFSGCFLAVISCILWTTNVRSSRSGVLSRQPRTKSSNERTV